MVDQQGAEHFLKHVDFFSKPFALALSYCPFLFFIQTPFFSTVPTAWLTLTWDRLCFWDCMPVLRHMHVCPEYTEVISQFGVCPWYLTPSLFCESLYSSCWKMLRPATGLLGTAELYEPQFLFCDIKDRTISSSVLEPHFRIFKRVQLPVAGWGEF